MKRAALILLTAIGAGVALGSGSAGAGEQANDTVVTSEPLAGGGYKLVVNAAPGQANVLLGHNDLCGGMIFKFCVSDEVGMTDDSPRCAQVDSDRVACQLQGLRRVSINTGDEADDIRASATDPSGTFYPGLFNVIAGRGRDQVEFASRGTARGGGGGDTLQGRRGNQRLLGGRGGDKITAGRGNNDHCDGQAGNDSGGAGCETEVSL